MRNLLFAPLPIKRIAPFVTEAGSKVLDVGCGYGSPGRFKSFCPQCDYYGLDQSHQWLEAGDLARMKVFYEADLDHDELSNIPDSFFDGILLSHVIEHLHNGEKCLQRLAAKLKRGGVIYVEYPGVNSLRVPRAQRGGFLHFHDDPTHVRLYSVPVVANALLSAGCEILKAGTRRDPVRLALSPFLAGRALVTKGSMWSGRLWDLFGIAEFVIARRTS